MLDIVEVARSRASQTKVNIWRQKLHWHDEDHQVFGRYEIVRLMTPAHSILSEVNLNTCGLEQISGGRVSVACMPLNS